MKLGPNEFGTERQDTRRAMSRRKENRKFAEHPSYIGQQAKQAI